MDLDPRTIVFTNVAITAMAGISLFVFSREHLAHISALRTWSLATLLQAIGWFFQGMKGFMPDVFPYIFGNGALILAFAIYHHTLARFTQQTIRYHWNYLAALLALGLVTYFLLVNNQRPPRVVTMSLLTAGIMLGSAWILSSSRLRARPSTWFTSLLFTLCGLFLLARGSYFTYHMLVGLPVSPHANSIWEVVMMLTLLIGSVLVTFGFLIMCNDEFIERQQMSEHALASVTENLNQAQHIARIGSWEWNVTTNEMQWSDELYELLKLKPETHPPSWDTFLHYIPEQTQAELKARLDDCIAEGTRFNLEHEVLREGASALHVITQGRALDDPTGVVIAGTLQDITERKLAEIKLINERLLLRTIIDNIPMNIFVKNRKMQKILANKAEVEFLGATTEEDILGSDNYDQYPTESAQFMDELDQQVLSGKSIIGREVKIVRSDGSERWVLGSKIPLRDSHQKVIGIVGISLDITDRKKTEQQIIGLSQTKDKFFSIVAHDLRSPLTSLKNFSSLLIDNIHHLSKEEISRMSEELLTTLDNTIKMADNLITWSRLQMEGSKMHIQQVRVQEIVEHVSGLYQRAAAEKNIRLVIEVAGNPFVLCDRDQFAFVVRNLVNNAIKFTPKKGIITVSARQNGVSTRLQVQDTGIGVHPDQLAKLFELRSGGQRKGTEGEKGTGLGLMLCREFIQMNKGRIWAENVQSGGAIFHLELPAA